MTERTAHAKAKDAHNESVIGPYILLFAMVAGGADHIYVNVFEKDRLIQPTLEKIHAQCSQKPPGTVCEPVALEQSYYLLRFLDVPGSIMTAQHAGPWQTSKENGTKYYFNLHERRPDNRVKRYDSGYRVVLDQASPTGP